MNRRKRNQRAKQRQYRRYQKELSRLHQLQPTYTFKRPQEALASDSFEAVRMPDDSLADLGVQAGDVALVFHTEDIRSGDIVLYKTAGEKFIGRFYPAPGGFIRLEPMNDEYEIDIFHPGAGVIAGRVFQFEARGEVATLDCELRPVRKLSLLTRLRAWLWLVHTTALLRIYLGAARRISRQFTGRTQKGGA